MNLVTVTEHAYEIRKVIKYLHVIHDKDPQGLMIDWLNMAAGVSCVEIVTEKYDSSIVFCETALSIEKERSILWSELSKELITFNFIWGSLEYLIKDFCPKYEKAKTTTRGRIFLKRNYNLNSIDHYEELFNELLNLVKYNMPSEIPHDFFKENYFARGIALATKIRNMFAHGSRELPEVEDYGDALSEDIKIINLASRITLFTIQMILLAEFYTQDYEIENPIWYDFSLPMRFNFDDETPIPLNKVLYHLHLENYLHYAETEQLSFKFNFENETY